MDKFFTHSCDSCGGVDEAKFTMSGPHVKQTCLHCGRYVKFFNKHDLPHIEEIRKAIWYLANADINTIASAKHSTGFIQLPENTEYTSTWPHKVLMQLQYWKLYLKVRSLVPSSE